VKEKGGKRAKGGAREKYKYLKAKCDIFKGKN
jgi:hypothetical protein